MSDYFVYIAYGFISLGVLLNFVAALALICFPDVYTRLVGSTKCITLGTVCILFGVFVFHGFNSVGVKALLCIVFVFLTSPVETQVLLKAAKKCETSAKEAAGKN